MSWTLTSVWIFPLTLCTSWMKWLVYHKVGYRKLNYLKTSLELFLNNCTCTRNTSCNNRIIQHTDKDWNNWNKCCIKLFHVNSVLSNLTLKKIETHDIFFVVFLAQYFGLFSFALWFLSQIKTDWCLVPAFPYNQELYLKQQQHKNPNRLLDELLRPRWDELQPNLQISETPWECTSCQPWPYRPENMSEFLELSWWESR